jgi:ribonuclease P protein component
MRFSQENVHSGGAKSHQPPPPQRPPSINRLIFPKSFRILCRNDFRSVAREHNRFFGKVLLIDSRPSESLRLGITAPRSFGNAVHRNRFKRLVREVFRNHRTKFPPVDLVVLPKKGAEPLSLEVVKKDLLQFIYESQCPAAKSC